MMRNRGYGPSGKSGMPRPPRAIPGHGPKRLPSTIVPLVTSPTAVDELSFPTSVDQELSYLIKKAKAKNPFLQSPMLPPMEPIEKTESKAKKTIEKTHMDSDANADTERRDNHVEEEKDETPDPN